MLKDGSVFGVTTQIKDISGNKVSIPGGFKVTSDSANNVSEGIVIEDAKGNQFVWIPVNSTSDFKQNLSYPYNDNTVFWNTLEGYPERNI